MNYTLTKNQMYRKDGDPLFVARTRVSSRATKDQVIERLAHASTLTEADINAVLSGLEKILVQFITAGQSVDLGFISLGFSIKGGFESVEDSFRKDRNWINVNATLANSFGNAVNQGARPIKLIPDNKAPTPLSVTKESGDLTLAELQPGNLVRLNGVRLSFNKADAETGVFLQSDDGNIIRVDEYAKIGDTWLILKVPDEVSSGNNLVEVRSRASDGSIVRGMLKAPVMVAN